MPWQAVRHQPAVDRFIVFPRRGLAGWRALARELGAERFDLLLLPQVSFKAGLVASLAHAGVKLGFDRARSRELHSLFVNRRIPHREPGHVQDAYLEFLEYLGIGGAPPRWDIVFTEAEREEQRRHFAALGRPTAAFVVASSVAEREWSPEGYARVMEHVAARGLKPAIVGGPSAHERAIAEAIVARCRAEVAVELVGPVRTMLWQLAGAALVVSPDTGPLHAAVAMNVPTIGLYGYTDPRRTGPYRYRDLLVDRYHEPDGERGPVRRTTRAGRVALITPDEVIAKVELALARYRPGLASGSGQ
jgi:heptosyltransferase I